MLWLLVTVKVYTTESIDNFLKLKTVLERTSYLAAPAPILYLAAPALKLYLPALAD